jgi:hypothetical protein
MNSGAAVCSFRNSAHFPDPGNLSASSSFSPHLRLLPEVPLIPAPALLLLPRYYCHTYAKPQQSKLKNLFLG